MKKLRQLMPAAVKEFDGELFIDRDVMEQIATMHFRDVFPDRDPERLARMARRMAQQIWESRYDPIFEDCRTPMQVFQRSQSRWGGRDQGQIPPMLVEHRNHRPDKADEGWLRDLWMTRPELFEVGSPLTRIATAQCEGKVPDAYWDARLDHFGPLIRDHAIKLTENPSGALIAGQNGVGKTYLAAAMTAHMIGTGAVQSFRWANVPELLVRIKGTFTSKEVSAEDVIGEYLAPPVLVLDDLGAENTTDFSWEVIYVLVNHRLERGLPTWVTTNLAISAFARGSGRIASRVKAFARIAIHGRDRRDQEAETGDPTLFTKPP